MRGGTTTAGVVTTRTSTGGARRRFRLGLAAAAAVGGVVRFGYVLSQRENVVIKGDGFDYFMMADEMTRGHFFVRPFEASLPPQPGRPPAWPLVLGAVSKVTGGASFLTLQRAAAAIGVVTVVAIGVVARYVARHSASPERIGLVAAGIAAVDPGLWIYERALLSETLFFLVLTLSIGVFYRYRDHPSLLAAAGVGAMCGLVALTRAEEALLVALIGVPLVATTVGLDWRRRIGRVLVVLAMFVAVIAPWSAYNSARVGTFIPLTTGLGNAMLAGACDLSYTGDRTGHYDPRCVFVKGSPPSSEPAAQDAFKRQAAITYTREHSLRLPIVVAARLGRTWGLYQPMFGAEFTADWMAAPRSVGLLWLGAYYLMVVAAVRGFVLARRARVTVWPLLVPFGVVCISVAITFGEFRYRAAAEVPLVILASFGIGSLRPRSEPADDDGIAMGVDDQRTDPEPDGNEVEPRSGARA